MSSIFDVIATKDNDQLKRFLSENPSQINDRNENGGTAMHVIAKKGHYEYPPQSIPKTLVDHGIDLNAKDGNGRSALEISLLSGWQKISMLLLDSGADKSVVTQDTKSRITCPDCKKVVRDYEL